MTARWTRTPGGDSSRRTRTRLRRAFCAWPPRCSLTWVLRSRSICCSKTPPLPCCSRSRRRPSWCARSSSSTTASHGSFFASRRVNVWLGRSIGLLLYSPFTRWRHDHAVHHASSGDLDRRGTGDVRMLTVSEYEALVQRSETSPTARAPPAGHVRHRAARGADDRPAHRRQERPPADAAQRAPHRRGDPRDGRPARVGARLAGLPARDLPARDAGGLGRHLAVLRPAPVRGRLLG